MISDPQILRRRQKFEAAVKQRDAISDGPKKDDVQAEVDAAFDEAYSTGYFRDPYNGASVLARFGLSWWVDVIPMLNKRSQLLPGAAHDFLVKLEAAEDVFEENVRGMTDEDQRYFVADYEALKKFLNHAIELNEPIFCSL